METKTKAEAKIKNEKRDYKELYVFIGKTIAYSVLTGFAAAAGGHAYASLMKFPKGKLISMNGGKHASGM